MRGGTAVAAVRLVHDAWRYQSDDDLRTLDRLLDEAEPEELRGTAEHLAIFVVGLATLFDEANDDWHFDEWLAAQGLAGATI
jgi:hypothetical protein